MRLATGLGEPVAERARPPEAEPLRRDGQGGVEGARQQAQGVADPPRGRLRRVRARRRRLPRLDARRRPPVHDPAAPARGQLRRAVRPHRARRRVVAAQPRLDRAARARAPGPPDAPAPGRARLPPHHVGRGDGRHRRRHPRRPGRDRTAIYLTSRGITNEVYYAAAKAARAMGVANIDSAARTCHAPSTIGLKQTIGVAASTCSMQDVLDTDLDRAVGHQRRQQPAGVHEVPVPGPQARRPGRRRQPVPRARPGALLGAVERRVGAVRHPAVRPPRPGATGGRRRPGQRRAAGADRARRRRPRLDRRPHRGLGRARRPPRPPSTAPSCWRGPASTRRRSSSSSTCTPARAAP